jgi:hypothetical protein
VKRLIRGVVLALGLALTETAVPLWAFGAAADSSAQTHGVAAATTLYNAGTVALERGAVGPSITFLLAASRLEPRAPDVRANLASALVAAARAAGDEERPEDGGTSPLPIAPDEAWWLAAGLLAVGAGFGIARAIRRLPRTADWVGAGLMIAGIALSTGLHYAAWEESTYPEAVVIAPTLSVERGPEEPSRPAVLLPAGERVRLGEARGGRVEIRLGANRIGWASREGLWRVADAPRYTSEFQPR